MVVVRVLVEHLLRYRGRRLAAPKMRPLARPGAGGARRNTALSTPNRPPRGWPYPIILLKVGLRGWVGRVIRLARVGCRRQGTHLLQGSNPFVPIPFPFQLFTTVVDGDDVTASMACATGPGSRKSYLSESGPITISLSMGYPGSDPPIGAQPCPNRRPARHRGPTASTARTVSASGGAASRACQMSRTPSRTHSSCSLRVERRPACVASSQTRRV